MIKLPSAKAAQDLFRETLDEIGEYIDSLWLYEKQLHDKRFITTLIDRDGIEPVIREEVSSEAEWERLCKVHGVDPTTRSLYTNKVQFLAGGTDEAPYGPLTNLIAIYALTTLPLEPLLKVLHPAPEVAEEEKLRRKVKELRRIARHIAALVRGVDVGSSPPIGEVSDLEQFLVWQIHELMQKGISSDTELYESLKAKLGDLITSEDDVKRLKGLLPPRPE